MKVDWASMCTSDLKMLEITESFDEIKTMKNSKYQKTFSRWSHRQNKQNY